jgi:hypothetical protein
MPQLPKDESLSAQGPLQCTSALHHIKTLMFGAANIKVKFKKGFAGLSSCLSLLHALARLMSERCSCIILLGSKRFHGLLSMSSFSAASYASPKSASSAYISFKLSKPKVLTLNSCSNKIFWLKASATLLASVLYHEREILHVLHPAASDSSYLMNNA